MQLKTLFFRILGVITVILASVALTVASGLYNLGWPSRMAVSPVFPVDYDLEFTPVRIVTEDRVEIAGWFVPKRGGGAAASVVVLPALGSDKGSIFPHVAFLAEDYDVLAIDFRRTGESATVMSTAGYRERLDARAAVAYLKKQGATRIGLYGFGMGGSVALSLAKDPDVTAVVAESARADLREFVEAPFAPFGWSHPPLESLAVAGARLAGLDLAAASPFATLPGVSKPILYIHATHDPAVSTADAEAIKAALAGDPKAEFWFPDSAIRGEGSPEFAKKLQDFYAANLR